MEVHVASQQTVLAPPTRRLLDRMVGPLTGLAQQVGFVLPGRQDARIVCAGGEMTGVHVARGLPEPAPGAYHIGGSGLSFNESVIKTLGETVERYAHVASQIAPPQEVTYRSADDMRADGHQLLLPGGGHWYSEEQLGRDGFPFRVFDPSLPTAWVKCRSLIDDAARFMLAQEAFPGYRGRPGEVHVTSAVSTGSAAHTRTDATLRNGLLELVQIDAAMGHWYAGEAAVRVSLGDRSRTVRECIVRRLGPAAPIPPMYWLPSADLPGFAIACLVTSAHTPKVAVGLGCDLSLAKAVAKAFLEATAVAQLAKVLMFRLAAEGRRARGSEVYDLDENVAHYAGTAHVEVLDRFANGVERRDDDLPPDGPDQPGPAVRHLVDAFRTTGKELVLLDLATVDVRALGMKALRVWSPDLLTLSLPSAPPLVHPRFRSYGHGEVTDVAHPYP